MNKKTLVKWGKWLIAPTLAISDTYKGHARNKEDRGRRVKRLNKSYLGIAIIITLVVASTAFGIDQIKGRFFLGTLSLYAMSRCNEIFMAFMKDVFDKLNTKKRDKNGLEYFERIQLALRSYIELILHYSILYYLLDTYLLATNLFNHPMNHLWDAIYFSVITIVSIGYGDIYPVHPLSKGLVMYEVINGMLLLVVSFTVYVNLTLDE